MEKEQIKKELAEIEQRAKELREELDKPEGGLNWKPDEGGAYYFITEYAVGMFAWQNAKYDQERLAAGNVYQTEGRAQQILDNRKTLVKLREYGFRPDWGDYCDLHILQRGGQSGVVVEDWRFDGWGCPVYFKTEELAQQALEAVGEEAVKQLLELGLV